MKSCCISLEEVSVAVDGAPSIHRNGLFHCIWKIFQGCASLSLVEIVGHVHELPSQERLTDRQRETACCEGQQSWLGGHRSPPPWRDGSRLTAWHLTSGLSEPQAVVMASEPVSLLLFCCNNPGKKRSSPSGWGNMAADG